MNNADKLLKMARGLVPDALRVKIGKLARERGEHPLEMVKQLLIKVAGKKKFSKYSNTPLTGASTI